MEGSGRWLKYRSIEYVDAQNPDVADKRTHIERIIPLSEEAKKVLAYVRQEPEARKPVGYDRGFLDAYRPNTTFYLTEEERAHLGRVAL